MNTLDGIVNDLKYLPHVSVPFHSKDFVILSISYTYKKNKN